MRLAQISQLVDMLDRNSPDVSSSSKTRAINAFLKRYTLSPMDLIFSLAMTTDGELAAIRNAGRVSQAILRAARTEARQLYDIRGCMPLKEALYLACKELDFCPISIDLLYLELAYDGMKTDFDFARKGGAYLAGSNSLGVIHQDIAKRAFIDLTKQLHPDVEDPITVIVRYPKEENEVDLTYIGISREGLDAIVSRFNNKGYSTVTSGRLYGLPVRCIQLRRTEKDVL